MDHFHPPTPRPHTVFPFLWRPCDISTGTGCQAEEERSQGETVHVDLMDTQEVVTGAGNRKAVPCRSDIRCGNPVNCKSDTLRNLKLKSPVFFYISFWLYKRKCRYRGKNSGSRIGRINVSDLLGLKIKTAILCFLIRAPK